jgi:glycine hydroxymethyltransferase
VKPTHAGYFYAPLSESDPQVAQTIQGELARQQQQIELIASENLVSRAVLEAQGSIFTNKTVEGYVGRRYHGGAEYADAIVRQRATTFRQSGEPGSISRLSQTRR